MRQSHLILSNALVVWVSRVLNLFPQLILVPYLIDTIGEANYGTYALVWPLLMSIDVIGNALQSGVVKYSAALLSLGRMQEVNKVVSSSFVYSIGLALIASLPIFVAADLFNDPSGRMGATLIVVGVTVLLMVPLTPFVAVIQSRQQYYVDAMAAVVFRYAGLAAVLIWFNFIAPSFGALIVIMAGTLLLSRIVQVPIAYRSVPGLQSRPGLFDIDSFRLIALFGIAMVLMSVWLVANSTGIRWLMGMLVSASFVAHMVIMIMPATLLDELVGAVAITFMPAASAYDAAGNQQMLKELLVRGTRYTTILVLSGLIVAALLMRNMLEVWVGADYAFLAPYALVLFAGMAFRQCTSISHHMLKGLGRLRAVVLIYFIGLAVVPIVSIVAIFLTLHNPYVAVTAGLVAGHVVCGCLQVAICGKAVRIDFRSLLLRSYAQPLAVAAVVYVAAVGLVNVDHMGGLIGRAGVATLTIVLFFGGCYVLIATVSEREQFKEMVQSVKSKMNLAATTVR